MKTKYCRSLAVLSAIIVTVLAIPECGEGQGVMQITQGILPINYTQQNVNDFVYAMENNLPSYGTWNVAQNINYYNISNVFYNGSSGVSLYDTLFYSNSVPFMLASVGISVNNILNSFSTTFGAAGVSFNMQGVGYDASNAYWTGNLNTPVTSIYVIGAGFTVDIGNSSVAASLDSWASTCPFTDTVTYTIDGTQLSSQTVFVVPEPTSWAMIVTGSLSLLLLRKCRVRK